MEKKTLNTDAIRAVEICEPCAEWLRKAVVKGDIQSAWVNEKWGDPLYVMAVIKKWQDDTMCVNGCVKRVMVAGMGKHDPDTLSTIKEGTTGRASSDGSVQAWTHKEAAS